MRNEDKYAFLSNSHSYKGAIQVLSLLKKS